MSALSQEAAKRDAAMRALELVRPGMWLGIGTGSTVAHFIDGLARMRDDIAGVVSSSERSTQQLRSHGFEVSDLNHCDTLDLYVDGADECDPARRLIKGGGGALTREKIVAAASRRFVCIIDAAKQVDVLGRFPVPIEVIPMARSLVARALVAKGGQPVWRDGFTTDNGNVILDVHGWRIVDPVALESTLNQWAGVVCVGLFAQRPADEVIVGQA
jgi:ribose 5-phosphate isomerase A